MDGTITQFGKRVCKYAKLAFATVRARVFVNLNLMAVDLRVNEGGIGYVV